MTADDDPRCDCCTDLGRLLLDAYLLGGALSLGSLVLLGVRWAWRARSA